MGLWSRRGSLSLGELSAKWAVCGNSHSQSPIDIDKRRKADLPALKAEFRPAELKIVHYEHMVDIVNTAPFYPSELHGGRQIEIGPRRV